MILWTSKARTEAEAAFPDMGRRSWRWHLEVEPWCLLLHQHFRCERDGSEWRPISSYFAVAITKLFCFGGDHVYYDGPHCSFSIGWLHFSWSYWDCKKCMKDGYV